MMGRSVGPEAATRFKVALMSNGRSGDNAASTMAKKEEKKKVRE
jgi:hypothetical protein